MVNAKDLFFSCAHFGLGALRNSTEISPVLPRGRGQAPLAARKVPLTPLIESSIFNSVTI